MKDDNQAHHNNKKQHHNLRFRPRKPSSHLNPNKVIDSNGPDIKIRGTASHIYDRYLTMARDSNSMGQYMMAENYLQHAEHYLRMLNSFSGLGTRPEMNEEEDCIGVEEYDRFTDHRPATANNTVPVHNNNVSVVEGYSQQQSSNRPHTPNPSFRRHNNNPSGHSSHGDKGNSPLFNPNSSERTNNRDHHQQHQPRRFPPIAGHNKHNNTSVRPLYSPAPSAPSVPDNKDNAPSDEHFPIPQTVSVPEPQENFSSETPNALDKQASTQNRPLRRPRLRHHNHDGSTPPEPSSVPESSGPIFLTEASPAIVSSVPTESSEIIPSSDENKRPPAPRRRTEQRWPRRSRGGSPHSETTPSSEEE